MKVAVAPAARRELTDIWTWNAKYYNIRHADSYLAFVKKSISKIGTAFDKGKPVPGYPTFRYILIKRRDSGHGHVVVYEIIAMTVVVLHVYHTAQDWQSILGDSE